jgi:hypothetical protein
MSTLNNITVEDDRHGGFTIVIMLQDGYLASQKFNITNDTVDIVNGLQQLARLLTTENRTNK